MRKRVYYVWLKGETEGSAIVATSPGKAKKYYLTIGGYLNQFYPDLRARVLKHLDDIAEKLPEATPIEEVMGWEWALRHGAYSSYAHVTCPNCGERDVTVWYDEYRQRFYCEVCEDEEPLKEVVG